MDRTTTAICVSRSRDNCILSKKDYLRGPCRRLTPHMDSKSFGKNTRNTHPALSFRISLMCPTRNLRRTITSLKHSEENLILICVLFYFSFKLMPRAKYYYQRTQRSRPTNSNSWYLYTIHCVQNQHKTHLQQFPPYLHLDFPIQHHQSS